MEQTTEPALKCKIFSTTMVRQREALGDVVTAWLRETAVKIESYYVRQSSDAEYHCFSIVLFYQDA
jgi:hypothetical protein